MNGSSGSCEDENALLRSGANGRDGDWRVCLAKPGRNIHHLTTSPSSLDDGSMQIS